MTFAPQLSPRPFDMFGSAIPVVALAILLRAGIIGLHHLEQIDYRRFAYLNFFALPVLGVIVLIIITPLFLTLKTEQRLRDAGMTVLMAVVINATLRIVDMIRTNGICDSRDFYEFENFCELIVMQSLFNIPFALIGTWVLLVLWLSDH